ncbi:hypothetical protein [Mesorhizobium sp. STM 4661]|uniref:hypothetical protein n=1 Tax=Mesorhizobium sp. STM 4661 TaxID=1297570 RepID=UPI0012FC025D|nr:hypothetical protein [Mesorhizobium sp. STM 4661]
MKFWIHLKPDEILYLEGAEDIDQVGRKGAKTVSVKRVNEAISLNTKSVRESLCNFWRHRRLNPDQKIFFQYISIARIAVEYNGNFGRRVAGLSLWERAKVTTNAEERDRIVGLLQRFLSTVSLEPDITLFIQRATQQELFDALIKPISWQWESEDASSVEREIKAELVRRGRSQGKSRADSEMAFEQLVTHALQVASQKGDRRLTADDFDTIFESAGTGAWIPVLLPSRTPLQTALYVAMATAAGGIVFLGSGALTAGVFTGLIALVGAVIFERISGILASGDRRNPPHQRKDYGRLRRSLGRGGYTSRLFILAMYNIVEGTDEFFGDAHRAKLTVVHRFLRLKNNVPLWTIHSFDRCLLIASAYPLTCILLFWSISGKVDQAQLLIRLNKQADQLHLALGFVALLIEAVSFWLLFRSKSWFSAASAIAGGAFAVALAALAGGAPTASKSGVFILAGIGAAALGVCMSRSQTRFAFRGAVSGIGVVAGVIGGIITFGWLGSFNWIAGAAAGGVTAVVVAGFVTVRREALFDEVSRRRYLFFVWLILLVMCGWAAFWLPSATATWGKTGPMALYIGFLPLISAPFVWFSVGLTRALMHRGLERRAWWPLFYAVLDAAVGVLLVVCLSLSLVIAVQFLNAVVQCGRGVGSCGTGAPLLELSRIFRGLDSNPSAPQFWWVYALVGSALIPSALNLMVGGASLMCGFPGLPALILKKMPVDDAPLYHDRNALALVWTFQIIVGALAGIAVQVCLVWVIVKILMPSVWPNLLEMCERAFELHLPQVIISLF